MPTMKETDKALWSQLQPEQRPPQTVAERLALLDKAATALHVAVQAASQLRGQEGIRLATMIDRTRDATIWACWETRAAILQTKFERTESLRAEVVGMLEQISEEELTALMVGSEPGTVLHRLFQEYTNAPRESGG